MRKDEIINEIIAIILGIIILGISIYHKNTIQLQTSIFFITIIILVNILIKKIVAYTFETKITTKIWTMDSFGFPKKAHFKKPLPMIWLPLLLSAISSGLLLWLPVFTFDIDTKPERASKRHGLYRFTQVTEWHIAIIVMWGIFANLIVAIFGYILGYESFARLSIFYAVWSLIPISTLDGSKLFFGNRGLWIITAIITGIFFILTLFF